MSSDEEYGDEMDDGESYDDDEEYDGAVPSLDPMLEDAYNTYEDDLDLDDISEELVDQTAQVNMLETRLKKEMVTKEDIALAKSQLPTIFGNLEDLQFELDGLSLESEADKLKRKQLLVEIEALFVRIQTMQDLAQIQIAKLSDELRMRGNDLFKAGKHAEAVKTYDDAISLDSHNAVLFTNRALAKQKLDRIDEAILDARRAVTIDTSTLKGYVILIKCLNSKGDFVSSTVALDSVPLAYETRPEVVELRALTAAGAKESGNAHFKAGRLDDAIGNYTVAIKNDPSNHLLYSNRSAAYQSKKAWDKGAADGEACLRLCESFPKAYVHLGRCQVQLKRWGDALATVAKANAVLGSESEELKGIQPQLKEIVESVEAGQAGRRMPGAASSSSSSSAASERQRAEAVKEKGNECYKEGEYQEAIRFYSQAIAICPSDGSYYGNRAAAWHMIREFKRAMADCVEGLKLEKTPGSLDKLRLRQANALANLGDIAGAMSLLEEAVTKTPESAANFDKTIHQLRSARMHIDAGNESLSKSEFSRAKRLFQLASTQGGVADNPAVRLGCARCHLGLGEFDDASREAQKVISTTGGAGQVSVDAYLCRAEALQATGSTDLASKHLSAALQMDPDNQAIQIKVKTLRRIINETTRVRAEVDEHMNKSAYDKAVLACADGLLIDKDSKKLMSEMHYRRAFAYSKLAKQQARTPAPATATAAASEGDASSPQKLAEASWRRVLQDCNSAVYYEPSGASISLVFLKSEALQALGRFEEAVSELDACYNNGTGKEERSVREKLQEAQAALKKSKRVDLYGILGTHEQATEAEIKKCYKKSALKWHPDRHSSGSEADKKKAEAQFKLINDAYELLTDPQRKALWDKGYDRQEIEEKLEQEKQRQQYGGGGGHYGHSHGRGGGYGGFPGHGGGGYW